MLCPKRHTGFVLKVLFSLAATCISPPLHAGLDDRDFRFHTMPETSYYGGIHSIAKDSIGRIWFSGYDALFMYNGSTFERMNDLVTSLSPSTYWSYGQVVTDRRGGLYFGTNHGLLRFDYRMQAFDRVLDGNIGSVTVNRDGTVWLIRDNRIESFSPERLPDVVRYELPPDCSVQTLALICTTDYVYAATGGKLYRLNRETGQYSLFTRVGDRNCVIRDVMEYGGAVWVLTQMDGIRKCDADGRIVRAYRLPSEYEKSAGAKELFLDPAGIIWAATQSGLFLVDPATDRTRLLRSNLHYPYSLPNNSVWSIFPDPDGGVWVGTYGGKLAYMTVSDNGVDYFKATPGGLNHPIVSCFEEDGEGGLWIGTEGGGLNYWDRKRNRFVYYTQENRSGITSNMIKRLQYDRKGTLLVSAFNGGIKSFDQRRAWFSDLSTYSAEPQQPLSVYDFAEEGDAGMWLTNPDAELLFRHAQSGRVETVRLTDPAGKTVRLHVETLFHDSRGALWLVTHNGAYVVDAGTRRIRRHYYVEDAPYAVNNLCSYCLTSESEVWFGTRGGGINRLTRDGRYVNFRDRSGEGLAGKTVFGILEDASSQDVWFSTNDGLYYYDAADDTIRKSQIDSPNHCGAYYVRACYRTSAGEMLFGGTDGFILFNPEKIKHNDQRPKVFFTDLLINNRPVKPGDEGSPLHRAIATMACNGDEGDAIRLTYRQSNLEICFSANSYLDAGKNQYAYRMLGLSERWSLLPRGQKSVQFFNLPAGSYTFEVRAANNDSLWGDTSSALLFEVNPSPFLSRWAYALYGAFLLAAACFIWRYFTNKKIYEQRLQLERLKERNMRELTKARINFFTNISHDLKTPLTLVVDPLKQLKGQLPADSACAPYVHMIEKNVGRIQHTISQLLQFREIESQKITLNRQPGDLIRFIDSIFTLFEFYANRKGIETDFSTGYESFYTRFDHDVIEKIITNLFSNAIKYTSENGYVGVRIRKAAPEELPEAAREQTRECNEYISLTVTNTGAEIPDDKKELIFESFNRLSARRPRFENSTGLGLAIVRELVDNLKGKISLHSGDSKVCFTVVLPFAREAGKTDSAAESYDYTVSEIDNLLQESDVVDWEGGSDRKAYTIVVIEDDPDLRHYLKRRLSEHYNVHTAANGMEGIAKVEKLYPQIVISDLMMPEADGFHVCRTLRSNIRTSHIPVIVLSGLGKTADNRIKALECGANVFLDKPFDMDYLLRQVDNLIRTQNELKQRYSRKYVAEPSKLTISSMDEELLKKAMNYIERNIDNNGYDVDAFVADMAIGRTLLYQKIKDITGMSIKEFILDIRLKRAAQLLRDSELTISEISDMTGFANPKYFSICFKRHFEAPPSEFKKKP